MTRTFLIVAMAVLLVWGMTGCGSVTLRGDAMTAAETSTMDAYQAIQRATTQPESVAWQKAYLQENFCQWRWFVRSAKKDTAWGPKLPAESAAEREGEQ